MENIIRIDDNVGEIEVNNADILPANLTKIIAKFDIIRNKISEQKNSLDEVNKEIKTFEKLINNFVKNYVKKETKPKKPRKKSGFALPVTLSDDLCDFMDCEKGTKRARTQITKYLNLYIDENNLKNPENKRIIVPDAKLRKLLGDEIEGVELTYFTIQKYMNKHFV
uniref:DM2 domain-containing protein n=1 Tax=viral metagenome TaxID=1070528 RepID=A0A6C0HAZ7_9ZZZZ